MISALLPQAWAGQYVVYGDNSKQAGAPTLQLTIIAMLVPVSSVSLMLTASQSAPAVLLQTLYPAMTQGGQTGPCSPLTGCFQVTATDTFRSYALRRIVVTATVAASAGAFATPAAPFTITLAGGWTAAASSAPVVNPSGRNVVQVFDWVSPPGTMGQPLVFQVQLPGDTATMYSWCGRCRQRGEGVY